MADDRAALEVLAIWEKKGTLVLSFLTFQMELPSEGRNEGSRWRSPWCHLRVAPFLLRLHMSGLIPEQVFLFFFYKMWMLI